MPDTQINRDSRKNIFNSIKNQLKNFDSQNVGHKEIIRYYRRKNNLNNLLKDIKYIDINKFKDKNEYREFVSRVLIDVIDDWKASKKDKDKNNFKSMKIKKINEFLSSTGIDFTKFITIEKELNEKLEDLNLYVENLAPVFSDMYKQLKKDLTGILEEINDEIEKQYEKDKPSEW